MTHRYALGFAAVLLLVGVSAGAQTPTAPTDDAATAAIRARATAGDAAAQGLLGFMYGNGQGVPQDHAQAVSWYRKAADSGNADAQYNLGLRYAYGQGVQRDDAQAVSWYRKAADQGNADAQYSLGQMYGTGRGVSQDFVEADKWLWLAGPKYAETKWAAEKSMTPQQLAEAQRRLSAWLAAFEKRGGKRQVTSAPVRPQTAVASAEGAEIAKVRKSAEQGNGGAQLQIALWYANGQGVPQDYVQAVWWFRRALGQESALLNAQRLAFNPGTLAPGTPTEWTFRTSTDNAVARIIIDSEGNQEGAAPDGYAELLLRAQDESHAPDGRVLSSNDFQGGIRAMSKSFGYISHPGQGACRRTQCPESIQLFSSNDVRITPSDSGQVDIIAGGRQALLVTPDKVVLNGTVDISGTVHIADLANTKSVWTAVFSRTADGKLNAHAKWRDAVAAMKEWRTTTWFSTSSLCVDNAGTLVACGVLPTVVNMLLGALASTALILLWIRFRVTSDSKEPHRGV